MESETHYPYVSQHVGLLSFSLGGLSQVAAKNVSQEDILSLQLKSGSRAANPTSVNPSKTNHGSSLFYESPVGQRQGYLTRSQLQTMSGPKEGPSLTLGFANACESGVMARKCGGLTHDRGRLIDGDESRHVYVDLGLGLATCRGDQLTFGPYASQGATLAVDRETPQGLQYISCGSRVHGNSASVDEDSELSKSGSVHEGILSGLPCYDTEEIDLQLGLPGSSFSMKSDCVSLDVQEVRVDISIFGPMPVIDEGSTSARLIKAGGSVFLGCRPDTESPSSAQRHVCTTTVGASDADTVMLPASSFVPKDGDNLAGVIEGDKNVFFGGGDTFMRLNGRVTGTSNASFPTELSTKTCKFKGCSKGARGASGLCIAHGGGRRCQRLNCKKGAEGRTMFCKAHGGGRRCESLGCIKSAEGRTDFCIAHGGGRRCMHDGCSKAARGRSGLCIRHGGGKRCQREGCTKSAEGFSGLCISHGGGRRCQFPDCGKGAQGSTKFCKGHGGGRRCEFDECTKGAEGSTPFCKAHGGGKRCTFGGGICTKSVHGGTAFCVAHGGGKRCCVTGCTKSARGRTDFCVRHGGGKRCKVEDCSKSAQGSTDYCKAHGGGKRCLWGQEGSVYEGSMLEEGSIHGLKMSCDKFARGNMGHCSMHSDLLEQYHLSFSSTPSLHSSISEHLYSTQSPQAHSDLSDRTSQLNEEQHSPFIEHELGISGEGSWRPEQLGSSPVVFKAQAESRTCVAANASWQDTADGFAMGNATPNEEVTCWIPGQDRSLCNSAAGGRFHIPYEQLFSTSAACLPRDFISQSPRIRVGSDALQHFGESIVHSPHEDHEGRVHGGGQFMAFFTRKVSDFYQ